MKILLRYNFLISILFSITFLLSACGSQSKEEAGSVTIQSSPFSEIKTIAAKVKAYLEIGGKTCEFELDPDDTTLKDNQKCTDIPMGSHSYKIVYKFIDTGVILANTEGTITLISGKDNEIYLAPPEKDIDDDGDGFKNFYEILQGTDPKDPGLKPVEDKTPPAVSSTNPANNSTNVSVNSKISATFSEAIDSKTITNETFTVSNGSTNIPGTVAINGTTATFTPSANLSYNTTYTAMINTGIKDLAGNTIAGNYSWSFTTNNSSTNHLPKTGQTTCYDSSGSVIACAGTGQDGDLLRGVAWPNPRFTDNGDSTVTDNLTGLDWTKDGNAPGPAACSPASAKTWQDALNYVACLNANSYLGYTDWRLPNINELRSLAHDGQSDTAAWLNSQGFNNVQSDVYWSSTSLAYYPNYAWIVYMWNGHVFSYYKSLSYEYVWPVRSGQSGLFGSSIIQLPKTGQTTCYDSSGSVIACAGTGQDGELQEGVAWPNPRFTDNGDSTETDNLTGLVWTKDGNAPGHAACSPATFKTWQGALNYVACLNANSYLGYTDWRLPNINELRSLSHDGQSDTAAWLNSQGFNNVQSGIYWSSTSYAGGPDGAWIVVMWNGYVNYRSKSSHYLYYVWPVRSGQ